MFLIDKPSLPQAWTYFLAFSVFTFSWSFSHWVIDSFTFPSFGNLMKYLPDGNLSGYLESFLQFPYNSVLLSLFWLHFHCIHSPSLFCLSANRSQEPLREFCEHLIISVFSCTSERYCRIWQLKEEQLLKCNKMYLKLSSLLKVIERFA